MRIFESGMTFGDFDKDDCFNIEKYELYKKSLSHLGFKTVEFVLYRHDKLLFVEAKPSLRTEVNGNRFSDEVADISQKFMDALQIVCGLWHGGRKDKAKLPQSFSQFHKNGKGIVFVLVVKDGKKKDLLTTSRAISRQLLRENRLWRFDIKVLNEELAKNEKLVVASNLA